MKKVLVIGCPGAGKTTFSRELAKITGLPLIHLDYYYHDKSKNYYDEKNKPAWVAEVKKLMKPGEWIMDGNYSSSFPVRFPAADTIIFFDFPLYLRLFGVLKRRWEYRKRARADMPGDWKEHINWEFLKFVIMFRRNYYHKITDVLDGDSKKKIIIFRNRTDTAEFLNNSKVARPTT